MKVIAITVVWLGLVFGLPSLRIRVLDWYQTYVV